MTAAAAAAGALAGASPAAAEISPRSGEAFFGIVRVQTPRSASRAELWVEGRRYVGGPLRRGKGVFRVRRAPGRVDLVVRYLRGRRVVARDSADNAWLLPAIGLRAKRAGATDGGLTRRLTRLGRSYSGWAALWAHDLRTGRTAGWNVDAPFPAASLVKLGVLAAALERFGAEPRNPRVAKEIRDLAVWSSNRASNRLLLRIGGSQAAGAAIVQGTLWRLGATSSTFTGFYRLGTAVAIDAPRPPPFLAHRRTTARDVGRILFELHAAAAGNRLSLRRTRLTRREARLALGLLLSSDPRGTNAGLFHRALPSDVPAAQKHGWTTSVRHSAAIVYGPRGPVIAVVLTWRPKIRGAASRALGGALIRAVTGSDERAGP